MSEIYIGRIGRILEGDETGWMLQVIDDAENTGGFLVVTWHDDIEGSGYDGWVEDYESLEQYFEDSHWVIEWFDEDNNES